MNHSSVAVTVEGYGLDGGWSFGMSSFVNFFIIQSIPPFFYYIESPNIIMDFKKSIIHKTRAYLNFCQFGWSGRVGTIS